MLHLVRQIARGGGVRGIGVHHDLHHAQGRHQHAPQRLARLVLAALAGKGIVGRHGPVARRLHRVEPTGRQHLVRRPDHPGAVAAGADLGFQNARHTQQRVFNRQGASRTVHALDHQIRLPLPLERVVGTAERRPLLGIVEQAQVLQAGCGFALSGAESGVAAKNGIGWQSRGRRTDG